MGINFPDAPTTGQISGNFIWDGEKWTQISNPAATGAVRYDLPQGLTANQMAQARSNIAVTKKNYIINGGMQVSQENGTAAGGANFFYPADMFNIGVATEGTFQIQQSVASTANGNARIRVTVGTADAIVGASNYVHIQTVIEGLRAADLRWGSGAGAKTVTLQFGCRGPAGTYCVVVFNGAANRSYVAEYVIAAGEANTDVVKSVVIPGDVTGTWAADNTTSIIIRWGLMAGSTYQQSAGSWGTVGNVVGSANQFNLMATSGNIFDLFDVGLYEGNVAPPFMVPDYVSELALCRRYWTLIKPDIRFAATAGGAVCSYVYPVVDMRSTPTITQVAAGTGLNITSQPLSALSPREITIVVVSTAAGDAYINGRTFSLNARM